MNNRLLNSLVQTRFDSQSARMVSRRVSEQVRSLLGEYPGPLVRDAGEFARRPLAEERVFRWRRDGRKRPKRVSAVATQLPFVPLTAQSSELGFACQADDDGSTDAHAGRRAWVASECVEDRTIARHPLRDGELVPRLSRGCVPDPTAPSLPRQLEESRLARTDGSNPKSSGDGICSENLRSHDPRD